MAVLFNRRETPASKVQDWTRRGLLALGMENYGANKLAHKVTNGLLALTPLGAAEEVTQGARGITDANRRGEIAPVMSMQNALGVPAIFLGGKAKGADLAKMKLAAQMKKAGASRDDIWKQTGWFQGVDKKWRFEVDDSGAKLARERPRFGPLQQEYKHPEIYNRYDLQVDLDPHNGRGYSGTFRNPTYWDADIPSRRVRAGDVDERGRLEVAIRDPKQMESTIAHELQHGIQNIERFARGGNPSNEAAILAAELDAAAVERIMADASPSARAAIARHNALKADWDGAADIPPEVQNEVRAILAMPEVQSVNGRMAEVRAMRAKGGFGRGALESGLVSPDAAMDRYRRLAGEVEARNVQTRLPMSAAERLATPPWATQDVADADQIVRRR